MKEIEDRRSVRNYNGQPVGDQQILQLLQSARLAPSGSNTQPWHFIVVRSPQIKEKIAEADHDQKWMLSAPVFLVCVADIRCRIPEGELILEENSDCEELKQIIRDTAIASEHIVLEAQHMGLNTCWTAWFRQDSIRPILGIPQDKYVCGILTIGYSEEKPRPVKRRKLEQIYHCETW